MRDILIYMDSQWLKKQFACNPDRSKTDLAHYLGLEPPAISKILNNTRQIKAQEYNLMRKFFGLPVDGEQAAMPENAYRLEALAGEQAPLLRDGADGAAPQESWILPAGIVSQRTNAPPDKIKIFTVQENLMEPEFRRGEPVLVDMSDVEPSPAGTFIVSDGFGVMLRHCEFIPNSDPAEIKISARRKGYQTHTLKREDFNIIGRVIAKLQWL